MEPMICAKCGKPYIPKGYNNNGDHEDCYYPRLRVMVIPKPDGEHWLEDLVQTYDFCDECMSQLEFWLNTPEIFVCDPRKNQDCKKTSCYIHGGPCQMTLDKECAGEAKEEKE